LARAKAAAVALAEVAQVPGRQQQVGTARFADVLNAAVVAADEVRR
jgi:hypothetical protein